MVIFVKMKIKELIDKLKDKLDEKRGMILGSLVVIGTSLLFGRTFLESVAISYLALIILLFLSKEIK